MPDSIFIIKYRAEKAIDVKAGEVRLRFITDVAGQQAVYLRKLDEASLYVSSHASSPSTAVPGPHLMAESLELGSDALVVAQDIISTASLWLQEASPLIEAKRIGGKARVGAASTPEDVLAERDAAIAALDALRPLV